MSRKKSTTLPPLTNKRVAELAEIIADPLYAVGPQDEQDIIEALRELVERRNAERRNAERLIQSLTVDDERDVA